MQQHTLLHKPIVYSMKTFHLARWCALACITILLTSLPLHAASAHSTLPFPEITAEAAGYCPERLDRLHEQLQALVDAEQYSGYISLLARDGKLVDWRSHGEHELGKGVLMQPDSIVRIYSMSKIITSVAVLTLLERGQLRLTDRVETYLPELANRQVWIGGTLDEPELEPAERAITIEDLLRHTGGYYYDAEWSAEAMPAEWMQRQNLWRSTSSDDFVQRVATLPLHEQPGTRFRYGIHTDLLGVIVERISGQDLESFLQEHILQPLGMVDTSFDVPKEKLERRAAVHHRTENGLQVNAEMDWRELGDTTFHSGGGGLYSTAADYARFAQMLLNEGELDGVRILSPKTVQLMRTNRIAHLADPHPFGAKAEGFGLGVRVLSDLSRSPTLGSLGTFGWDGAASTQVQIDPVERTVAILLLQHVPFNEDNIFAYWTNGLYAALVKRYP